MREPIIEGAEPHPLKFVDLFVSFDLRRKGGTVTREKGQVKAQRWLGFTQRGRIPEYEVTIVGKAGIPVLARVTEDHVTPI
jgi:hypothetical protein